MRTTLQNGEKVALIVKKHWLVLAKPATIVLAVLAFATVRHSKMYGLENFLNMLFPYALAGSAALVLYNWLDRRTNIWAVTNLRLIDESGIISRKSKENPLEKINDIIVNQTVLGRIFGYGSICVQTAAMGETVVHFLETPQLLKETINAQKANVNKAEQAEQATQHRPGTVERTVLVQENTKPPFMVACPHCNGRIVLESASLPGAVEIRQPALATQPEAIAEEKRCETSIADHHVSPTTAGAEEAAVEPLTMEREKKIAEMDESPDPRAWRREAFR